MIPVIRHEHTLDPEFEARLKEAAIRLRRSTQPSEDKLAELFDKIEHAWKISLVVTGVGCLGIGVAVGRLTQKGD